MYFHSANATSGAEPAVDPGLRRLSKGMFCLTGWGGRKGGCAATTRGRHVAVGAKWRQRTAFGEVGSKIAELVYGLNLNVTVLLCPGANGGMVCVEYLHQWRISAGVSQLDHLGAECGHILHPHVWNVCIRRNMCVYLQLKYILLILQLDTIWHRHLQKSLPSRATA